MRFYILKVLVVDPLQLRSGGGWNNLMPELTSEPDSTGDKNKTKKKMNYIQLCIYDSRKYFVNI
jgi:hypothetical protein